MGFASMLVAPSVTENEAAEFIVWLRTKHPATVAAVREFYGSDGSVAGRYVELSGPSGRTQLWSSKADYMAARSMWLGGWAPALMIGIGAFLIGTAEPRSVIAGLVCLSLGASWVFRLFRLR